MNNTLNFRDLISYILGFTFVFIGIMNLAWVHPVPGTFYLLFSFIFYPFVNAVLKRKLGFEIPFFLKIILALFLIWATLAVSDLADICGI